MGLVAGAAASLPGLSQAQTLGDDFIPRLRALGSFRILAQIAATPEIKSALAQPCGATVLAPTDTAFALLPNNQLSSMLLPQNAAHLQRIMLRHIVPGRLTTQQYAGQVIEVTSVSGYRVRIDLTRTPPTANAVSMSWRDTNFSNGAIQVLNGILL